MPLPSLVALPRLHGPGVQDAAPPWTDALRLWPGLPDPPAGGWFHPDGYPFAPREAAACLSDLDRLGAAAMAGLPLGALADNARAASRAAETALREGLRAHGGNADAARAAEAGQRSLLARQQAQKALLWAWGQETRLLELAELAQRYSASAGRLAGALAQGPGKDGDAAGDEALAAGLARLDTPIAVDAGLVPPWRLVVANALYFLPTAVAVALETDARDAAAERLEFLPAPRWHARLAGAADGRVVALEARAPAWRLLGHTRPTGQPPLDADRLWLDWRPA